MESGVRFRIVGLLSILALNNRSLGEVPCALLAARHWSAGYGCNKLGVGKIVIAFPYSHSPHLMVV